MKLLIENHNGEATVYRQRENGKHPYIQQICSIKEGEYRYINIEVTGLTVKAEENQAPDAESDDDTEVLSVKE